MSTAVVSFADRNAPPKLLDGRKQTDEVVTPEDAGDTSKLSRLLTRLLADVAELRRRFRPRRITFRDITSAGTDVSPTRIVLTHRFGRRTEWWVVGVTSPGAVVLPLVVEITDPAEGADENHLVLDIYFPATLHIRVEESG